jgi:ABC-type dipeptide/oligopeptide/nickel transport system permease component
MMGLLVRRLGQLVFVLVALTALIFGLMHLSGDPVSLMAGEGATLADMERIRTRMGFDQPIHVQYGRYMADLLRGDLGTSLRQHRPVSQLVFERVPATLQLTLLAQLLAIVVAFPIGVISALWRNSVVDRAAMTFAVFMQAIPVFWLGIMLILVFSVGLRWTPVGGRATVTALVLPVVTLAGVFLAQNARLIRSSLLEVMSLDFIRTARSKGAPPWSVIFRHAMRNALIPLVTVLGLQFSNLLSGAVVTEMVFAWPGLGRLLVQAVLGRDVPLVLGATIIIAVFVVLINLVVDILYGVIDPRVRSEP